MIHKKDDFEGFNLPSISLTCLFAILQLESDRTPQGYLSGCKLTETLVTNKSMFYYSRKKYGYNIKNDIPVATMIELMAKRPCRILVAL